MKDQLKRDHRNTRDFYPTEGFGIWCKIEDLAEICGYDAIKQFDQLKELQNFYPEKTRQDPEEITNEHPMSALACLVKRFIKEYPETAEKMLSIVIETPKAA